MKLTNHKYIIRHILTCLLLLLAITAQAQPRYQIVGYEKLNNKVTQVNRIVRDGQGMMWFSTNDGLYRFDGYEFRNFKSHSGDGVNMQSNNINYMYSSSEGSIWCLVANRVFLFDTHCYRFLDVLSDYEQSKGITLKIKKLRALPCGVTWLFTDDGKILTLEDARPQESISLIAEREETDKMTVVCDAQERSWVLINSKTLLYHKGKLKTFHQAFRQIITTAKGVWLISGDGKLFRFDEKAKQIRAWNHPLLKSGISGYSMLSNGYIAIHTMTGTLLLSDDGKKIIATSVSYPVQKVMDDGNGHIWVLAQDGRLSMGDMQLQKTEEISGIRTEKCNIMRDKHGSVWIFTDNGGTYYSENEHPTALVRYANDELRGDITNTINDGQGGYWFIHNHHAYRLTFESPHYSHLPLQQSGQVRCIMKDGLQRILVASRYDESITVFQSGQRIGWLGRDGNISSSYVSFHASVYSSWLADDGTLWMGTKKDGVFHLRPRANGSFQISQYTKENPLPFGTISDNEIYAFAPDHHGRLWIATQKGGLCCITDYHAETPHFVHAENGLTGWKASQEIHPHALLVSAGKLLVGTSNGLFVADINSRSLSDITFRHHQREAHRSNSLSSSNITDILKTSDNRMFITTGDGGLNELLTPDVMADTLSFRHYNLTSGFPTDITHNMAEYDNALWITSPNQLVELQLKKTDAPDINLFLLRENPRFSSCRPLHIDKGRWIFGSEEGAILIDLNQLKNSTFIPPLVITGVSKENSPIDPGVGQNDTIILSSKERDLTIWFSALDFDNTELVAYAYRMGEDRPWQYIGQNHSVTFSQMRPGEYQMTIRSTNSNGIWCNNERTLTIIVKPTFWETPWALLLIILITAVVVSIVGYTLLYIRRIKRQQHETMEAYLALLSEKKEPESDHQQPESISAPSIPESSSEDEELMRKLIEYIEKNLGNSDITIDDMAYAVAVSRSGLHRKMKHLLGTSPMEFLREARIRKSIQMLKESNKSVSEIAYECGFSDPKYFSKCFKTSTGQTPTESRAPYPFENTDYNSL